MPRDASLCLNFPMARGGGVLCVLGLACSVARTAVTYYTILYSTLLYDCRLVNFSVLFFELVTTGMGYETRGAYSFVTCPENKRAVTCCGIQPVHQVGVTFSPIY